MFMPQNLATLGETIRVRACEILDNLPRNETFDWVDKVSVELTTQMLAILFDFPWEERRKLTRWSNVATAAPGNREIIASEKARDDELQECGAYFAKLWEERARQPMKTDLLSMMAHSDATRDMDPRNFLGNLILLIVGGNDTTRNSLSGSVYALNKFPDQYAKLRNESGAGAEPRAGSRALADAADAHAPHGAGRCRDRRQDDQEGPARGDVVRLRQPRRGDVRAAPDDFWIERPNARNHISFGFGIHRCLGLRLAELQLRIIWEEILKRFHTIEVVDEPKRIYSNFVKGYETLPVRIAA